MLDWPKALCGPTSCFLQCKAAGWTCSRAWTLFDCAPHQLIHRGKPPWPWKEVTATMSSGCGCPNTPWISPFCFWNWHHVLWWRRGFFHQSRDWLVKSKTSAYPYDFVLLCCGRSLPTVSRSYKDRCYPWRHHALSSIPSEVPNPAIGSNPNWNDGKAETCFSWGGGSDCSLQDILP